MNVKYMIVGLLAFMVVPVVLAETYRCSKCRERVSHSDTYCVRCGERVALPPVARTPERPRVATQVQDGGYYWQNGGYHWKARVGRQPRDYTLPVPLGMGRGLLEIVCSPVEILRLASRLECGALEKYKGDFGQQVGFTMFGLPLGTCVVGSLGALADIVVGTFDVISLGSLGNATWGTANDLKSPYVFERSWTNEEPVRYGLIGM